jgi:hypothetical protein
MAADGDIKRAPNAYDSRAEFYMQLQDRMKANRGQWETQWTEIAERISTKDDDFLKEWSPGSKRTYHVFDSTAALALPKFAAAMESMLTPRTQTWAKLVPLDDDLMRDWDVRAYLDRMNLVLFKMRYAPGTNFASQMNEVYRSLGAFGTGCLYVGDAVGKGLRYKSIYLGELFFLENNVGEIDHVHRKYKLTGRQAVQEFGESVLPPKIREMAAKFPEQKFDFLHVVCPNDNLNPRYGDARGMAYQSLHICYEERATVKVRGYHTQPYAVSRYVTSSNEVYGRSPAIDALPDIKMANAQAETILRAGQLAVQPPMLLSDDGMLQVFSTRPGSFNYGMVNAEGKPLALPLQTGANLQLGDSMLDRTHQVINDAFLVTLFQILVQNDREMTATEVLQRAQEKGALIAPTAARQQSELLGKIIVREIDVAARAGMLEPPNFPPMPRKLVERGGNYNISYQSPLSRMQRAEQAVGLSNTIGILTPVAQVDPGIFDAFDWDTITQDLSTEINGLPETWMLSPQALAALRQGKQQQQQQQQLVQAAPAASAAAANIAKIQSLSGAGTGQLPNLSALQGATQGQ